LNGNVGFKSSEETARPASAYRIGAGAGIFAAAEDAKAADIALDIYETTIGIIEKASRTGRYHRCRSAIFLT